MNDKNTEIKRYDQRAEHALDHNKHLFSNKSPLYLRPPEDDYRSMLSDILPGSKVLEIGAGMGENTLPLLDVGLIVCATDISPKSVRVMEKRFVCYKQFTSQVADMELLPFSDGLFDVVCSSGSLSYGDNSTVRDEIYRDLKKGGQFIAVDSLNHNPIYKLNRYIHFLRGHRSKSTLQRMPTQDLINSYKSLFGYSDIKYFGSLIWMATILELIFSGKTIAAIFSRVDSLLSVKKSAFKFTMKAVKS